MLYFRLFTLRKIYDIILFVLGQYPTLHKSIERGCSYDPLGTYGISECAVTLSATSWWIEHLESTWILQNENSHIHGSGFSSIPKWPWGLCKRPRWNSFSRSDSGFDFQEERRPFNNLENHKQRRINQTRLVVTLDEFFLYFM